MIIIIITIIIIIKLSKGVDLRLCVKGSLFQALRSWGWDWKLGIEKTGEATYSGPRRDFVRPDQLRAWNTLWKGECLLLMVGKCRHSDTKVTILIPEKVWITLFLIAGKMKEESAIRDMESKELTERNEQLTRETGELR